MATFSWQGDFRGGFCEKTAEATPMFDGSNAVWLQVGPAAGQS